MLVGGFLAGTLDAISAFLTFGSGMTYGIASGLLGSKAFPAAGGGGAAIWLLGLALHYLIAMAAAAIYVGLSRRWTWMRDQFVVGGILCGIVVYLVMNLVVLPLSAVPFPIGPFSVGALRAGIGFHIVLIGLPISASCWFLTGRNREIEPR
jgi:uncharacterized membrane protein YagU involved in acid resistance